MAVSMIALGIRVASAESVGDATKSMIDQGMKSLTSQDTKSTSDQDSRSMSDRDFVRQAVGDDMMNVRLGHMAWKQASNEEVRNFGRHMANSHDQAEKDLVTIADRNKIDYPRDMDREESNTVEHLSTLKGAEFDRAFMRHVIDDHQKSLDMYQRTAKDSRNSELRDYAQQQTGIIREHLETARDIESKIEHRG